MYSDTIFYYHHQFCDKLNVSRGVEYVADFKLTASHSVCVVGCCVQGGGVGVDADALFLFVCLCFKGVGTTSVFLRYLLM